MCVSHLTYLKAFQPDDLTSPEVLNDIPDNDVKWVTGRNQMVYWQECNVTIFYKDSKGKKDGGRKCSKRSGQGIVPEGVDLYCFGGKLKVS